MALKEKELRSLKNAWLSPAGEIVVDADDFAPLGAWHEELAQCIARDLLNLRHRTDAQKLAGMGTGYSYVYEWLEDRGWIRFCAWANDRWVVATRMTTAQRRLIEQWCEVNGRDWERHVDIVFEPRGLPR